MVTRRVWKVTAKKRFAINVIINVVIVAVIDWNLKTLSIMMLVKGTDFKGYKL